MQMRTLFLGSNSKVAKIEHEEMLESQRNDPSLQAVITECEMNNGFSVNKEFMLENDILYLTKRDGSKLLVVPWNLIESILYIYHNETLSVHLSRDRLYQLLRTRYYWYGMFTDVSRWINSCVKCKQVKPTQPLNHGLLQPIATTHPFEMVGVDILGPITETEEGYSYVLVCVDLFTSWVEAAPLKSITAEEVCRVFFNLIIARHGCPDGVLTDQGRQFLGKLFKTLCDQLGIRHHVASAYHHQTNGKVERFNKFLENGLALLVKKDQTDWCKLLDNCLFVYRVSLNRMLNEVPFFLLYGRDAVMPQDLMIRGSGRNHRTICANDLDSFKTDVLRTLRDAYDKLNAHKIEGSRRMKEYYDMQQKDVSFQVGDVSRLG